MSDLIFSSNSKVHGELTHHIHSIYHEDVPDVTEFHGNWGALAVSRNLYNGFQPLETQSHIFAVIGGPVLCFTDNRFLTGNNPVAGTAAISERYVAGKMKWDEDLSGPFAVLVVDKKVGGITCITDLMMFIPVYQYTHGKTVMLGTHVDALANAVNQEAEFDFVSLADFILNSVVTYPYTAYRNVRQCHPAAVHVFEPESSGHRMRAPNIYWLPNETNPYENIDQAATALREGLQDYVGRITEGMGEVAQFLSAGEDSRAILGLLPPRLKRNAFVFLDSMNREGRIGKQVASAYGASFHAAFRKKTHYLDILPEASDLIGSGHQYSHAHSLGFHKVCGLDRYSAVFGGYSSDALLKGRYAKLYRGNKKLPFLPQLETKQNSPIDVEMKKNQNVFDEEICREITQRRMKHLSVIQSFRPTSSREWLNIWPVTNRQSIPNLYSNRRLFRNYEPYMCKQAVKISAAAPTTWKLNRRLFNRAVRPFLEPSRWIFHADGRLPYFPWWFNMPIQCCVWFSRQIGKRTGFIKGNQGPWGDWQQVIKDAAWQNAIQQNSRGFSNIAFLFSKKDIISVFSGNELSIDQKVNLLQVMHRLCTNAVIT